MAPSNSERVRAVSTGFNRHCITLLIRCLECGQRTSIAAFCLPDWDPRFSPPPNTPMLFCNPCGKSIIFIVLEEVHHPPN